MPNIKAKNKQTHKLLTVKDVAELDNCSEKTVRRAIAAGLLEVIRVGPGGRLKVADLAQALSDPSIRTGAMEIIRGLIERVTIQHERDGVQIELEGAWQQ